MLRIVGHLAAAVLTVLIIHEILPEEVSYDTTQTLIIFALVLGLLDAVVLPILQIVALPLTCLTLGLFAFVLSAAVFYFAGAVVPGIEVTILGAIIGAVLMAALSGVLDTALRPRY